MLLKVFQWLSLSFRIKSKFFRRFTYIYLKTIVCFVSGTIVDTGDTEMKKDKDKAPTLVKIIL